VKKLSQTSHSQLILVLAILFIGVVSRLIPHPANMTPIVSLSLIAATQLRRWFALIAITVIILISDFLIGKFFGYPFLSSWSIFTYTGFLAIVLVATFQKQAGYSSLILGALVGTLGFWTWTNFGVWLVSGIYPHTSTGLGTCFFAALPFLRNSLAGSLVWMLIYLGAFKYSKTIKQRI